MRRLDVTRDAAALSLLPTNVDHFGALERLGALAAHRPGGLVRPNAPSWRVWRLGSEARRLIAASPPGIIDYPAAQTTVIDGREYAILLGRGGSEAIAARLLSEALTGMLEVDPHLAVALTLLKTGLALSEAVLIDSGLAGSQWPSHGDGRITIPSQQKLERLRAAVVVSGQRLERIGDLSLLDPLFGVFEDLEGRGYRPLMRLDQGVLVAAPFSLSSAVLVHVWERVQLSACLEQIAAQMRRQWMAETVALCELCDWRVERAGEDGVLLVELDDGTTAEIQLLFAQPVGGELPWIVETPAPQPIQEGAERLCMISALLACGGPAGVLTDPTQETVHWVLDAQGLEYLLDAIRLDPLALVRCHREIPGSIPSEAAGELLDVVGAVRYAEDNSVALDVQKEDPTELTIALARMNAARHCEPEWEHPNRATPVIRYRHSNDARVFVPLIPGPELRLLVTDGSTACWVSTNGTHASRLAAEAVLAHMTVYWIGKLMEVGLFKKDGGHGWSSTTVSYSHEDPQTIAAVMTGTGTSRLSFGAGFLSQLARSDNSADRRLIGALLDLIFGDPTDAEDMRLREVFLDELAPLGTGTFMIWNEATTPQLPADPPSVLPTSGMARLRADADLGNALRQAGAIGLARGSTAKDWLNVAVAGGIERLGQEVDEYGSELLERLVGLCELIALETEATAIRHPARAALGEFDRDELRGARENGIRNGAVRFLVEMTYARSPQGRRRVNRERLDRLRGLAELILNFAATSDAAYGGLVELEVMVPPNGPVVIGIAGQAMDAREAQWQLISDAAPDASRESHPGWWARDTQTPELELDKPIELDGAWRETSHAMRLALGFSLDDLVRVLRAVADRAAGVFGPVRLESEDLVLKTALVTNIDPKVCRAAIDFMSSRPEPNYDPLLSSFKPWKSGRDTGYLRRPLLTVDDSVLFSSMHVLISVKNLIGRLQSGRLRFEDRQLRIAAARLRRSIGGEWEDKLGQLIESLQLPVRVRCKQIGGRQLSSEQGNSIGDIDVLALDRSQHIVWALDAKSIAPDVTPLSLRAEVRQLEEEIPKHQRRLEWLERNRDAIVAEFALGSTNLLNWEIRGALVLQQPLGGAFMFEPALPIMTWRELRNQIGCATYE